MRKSQESLQVAVSLVALDERVADQDDPVTLPELERLRLFQCAGLTPGEEHEGRQNEHSGEALADAPVYWGWQDRSPVGSRGEARMVSTDRGGKGGLPPHRHCTEKIGGQANHEPDAPARG